MDPLSLAVGLALAAGAVFIDVRGVNYIKEKVEHRLELQAKNTILVIDQPTEKYVIDYDKEI